MNLFNQLNFFILVYNREETIPTLEVLHRYGIYDKIYLVVGDDDPKLDIIQQRTNYPVLVFNKSDVADKVDSIGTYKSTLKVCTYARVFVDEYAIEHKLKYICLLFDDIQSMQIRYCDGDKVKSQKDFDLKLILEQYLELLNINPAIYMVGPPGSSFYIGCKAETLKNKVASHYANMLLYDSERSIAPYKASVLEDMTIVLYNSMIGHIGLYPAGLQINCRRAGATNDAYTGIDKSELIQQYVILTGQPMDIDRPFVPYSRFIPKIISDKYRKV